MFPTPVSTLDHLLNLTLRSSVWMWPILLCAVLAVGVAGWQLWRLHRASGNHAQLYAAVSFHIEAGDVEGALALCQRSPSAVGAVLAEILTEHTHGVTALHRVADYATLAQRGRLATHRSHFLPTIAQVVMLCGLMGSIHGLIMGFGSFGGSLGPLEREYLEIVRGE